LSKVPIKELTELQRATLIALANACDYSLGAHPPERAIVKKFPVHLHGDVKKCLKDLHKMGLCIKHPTRGENTYNISQTGLSLSLNL
jgi:hypothetical protein